MEHSWEITVNSSLVKHAEVDGTSIVKVHPVGVCVENTLPYIVKDSDQYAALINFTLITACFYDSVQYWKDLPEQGRIVLFLDKAMDFASIVPKLNGLLADNLIDTVETNPFIVLSDIFTDNFAELVLRQHVPGHTKVWRYNGIETYRGDMDFDFMQDEIDQIGFTTSDTGILVLDYTACIEEDHISDDGTQPIDDIVLIAKDEAATEVQSMITSDTVVMLAEDSPESLAQFNLHKEYVIRHANHIDNRGGVAKRNRLAVAVEKANRKSKNRSKAKAAKKARKRK